MRWHFQSQAELIGKPAPDFEMERHGWFWCFLVGETLKPPKGGSCGKMVETKTTIPQQRGAFFVERGIHEICEEVTVDAWNVAKMVRNTKLVVYLATYDGLNAPNCGASAWISRELTWPKLVPRRLGEVKRYVDLWIKDPRNPTKIKLIWVFPKIGVPQNGWFIMENPIKMDDLGVPLFSETPI